MDNFKVIIAGSRGFSNYKLLREECNKFLKEKRQTHNIIIISGGHVEQIPLGNNTLEMKDLPWRYIQHNGKS